MRLLMIILALTLSIFLSGCSEKIVYIKTPCPTLQTWEVQPLDINLTYDIYSKNKVRLDFDKGKKVVVKLKECTRANKSLNAEIKRLNAFNKSN